MHARRPPLHPASRPCSVSFRRVPKKLGSTLPIFVCRHRIPASLESHQDLLSPQRGPLPTRKSAAPLAHAAQGACSRTMLGQAHARGGSDLSGSRRITHAACAEVILVNFRVLPHCLACAPPATTTRAAEMGQWADWPLPKEHAQIHGQDRCASPGGLHLDCEFWI